MNRLKVEYRPLAQLVPYAKNARVHTDAQIEEIAGSIRRFGFVNPVLVGADGVIIAGHGRVMAAKMLGLTEAPVIVLDGLSAAQRRALALADNRIALNSKWDEALLKAEVEALVGDDEDIEGLGFSAKELDELLSDSAAGAEVAEVPVSAVRDTFWISIRGPLLAQARALSGLQRAMDGIDGVEIEIGTTAVE